MKGILMFHFACFCCTHNFIFLFFKSLPFFVFFGFFFNIIFLFFFLFFILRMFKMESKFKKSFNSSWEDQDLLPSCVKEKKKGNKKERGNNNKGSPKASERGEIETKKLSQISTCNRKVCKRCINSMYQREIK